MAILTRAERKIIASPWVKDVIRDLGESQDLNFTDIEDAIQAIEDFLEISQRDFVASLPEPFKSSTTDVTKDLLLFYTLAKRVEFFEASTR